MQTAPAGIARPRRDMQKQGLKRELATTAHNAAVASGVKTIGDRGRGALKEVYKPASFDLKFQVWSKVDPTFLI